MSSLEVQNQLFGFDEAPERRRENFAHCAFAENALSCWPQRTGPFCAIKISISDSWFSRCLRLAFTSILRKPRENAGAGGGIAADRLLLYGTVTVTVFTDRPYAFVA